jgi:hypothetical protein
MKPPSPFVYAFAAIVVEVVAWITIVYAQRCLCDQCKEPFGIFLRGAEQLCHPCASKYDRALGRVRRRRSLLRRIRRFAA